MEDIDQLFSEATANRDPKDLVFPRFHIKAVQNNFRSEQEGRPIFDDKEFVEIMIAGDSKSRVVEEVNDEHKRRWPHYYRAFKEQREAPMDGTPLEEWPALSTSKVMELKAVNIRTVENLAHLNDSALSQLGTGGRELRNRAKAWLEQAAGGAPLDKALQELEAEKSRTAVLEQSVKDLAAQVERLAEQLKDRDHDQRAA